MTLYEETIQDIVEFLLEGEGDYWEPKKARIYKGVTSVERHPEREINPISIPQVGHADVMAHDTLEVGKHFPGHKPEHLVFRGTREGNDFAPHRAIRAPVGHMAGSSTSLSKGNREPFADSGFGYTPSISAAREHAGEGGTVHAYKIHGEAGDAPTIDLGGFGDAKHVENLLTLHHATKTGGDVTPEPTAATNKREKTKDFTGLMASAKGASDEERKAKAGEVTASIQGIQTDELRRDLGRKNALYLMSQRPPIATTFHTGGDVSGRGTLTTIAQNRAHHVGSVSASKVSAYDFSTLQKGNSDSEGGS
jgi:hypothetical protein